MPGGLSQAEPGGGGRCAAARSRCRLDLSEAQVRKVTRIAPCRYRVTRRHQLIRGSPGRDRGNSGRLRPGGSLS